MPKYLVSCNTGFCGVDELVIVEAEDENAAETIALEWWTERVEVSTSVTQEIDEDSDEFDSYEEIT